MQSPHLTVDDVAAYILQQTGEISSVKLHKLLYYAQAWHLAWSGRPLYREKLEAWANGPIVASLWYRHRGTFALDTWAGDATALSEDEQETVDVVIADYGPLTGSQLSHLVKREEPWLFARRGIFELERCHRPIGRERLRDFYRQLGASTEAKPISELDWPALGVWS
jgi:uncharacterized phage-associated protein